MTERNYHYDQIIKSDKLALVQARLADLLTHSNFLQYDSVSLIMRDALIERILSFL